MAREEETSDVARDRPNPNFFFLGRRIFFFFCCLEGGGTGGGNLGRCTRSSESEFFFFWDAEFFFFLLSRGWWRRRRKPRTFGTQIVLVEGIVDNDAICNRFITFVRIGRACDCQKF